MIYFGKCGLEEISLYKNSVRVGWSGEFIPVVNTFSTLDHTVSMVDMASYRMGTGLLAGENSRVWL